MKMSETFKELLEKLLKTLNANELYDLKKVIIKYPRYFYKPSFLKSCKRCENFFNTYDPKREFCTKNCETRFNTPKKLIICEICQSTYEAKSLQKKIPTCSYKCYQTYHSRIRRLKKIEKGN